MGPEVPQGSCLSGNMGVICCIGLVLSIPYGDSSMRNNVLFFEALKLSSTFTFTFHAQLL